MRKITVLTAAMAVILGATAAQAGGGTGGSPPVGDPGDPGGDPGDPGNGGENPPGGETGNPTPTPSTPGVSTSPTGVGTIFTLENMPTGYFNPYQDYTDPFGYTIPSEQGVLTQTVDGYTMSLSTAPYILSFDGSTPPRTSIQILDQSIFQYAPTFADAGAIGTRSLASTNNGEVFATFSRGITDFSVLVYDFANDIDFVTLNAYSGENGTGTLLKSVTIATANNAPIPTYSSGVIGFSGLNGARSVGFDNSTAVFYDNFSAIFGNAAAVPEPATWSMMLLGFGMIGFAARRRPARTTVKFILLDNVVTQKAVGRQAGGFLLLPANRWQMAGTDRH